MENMNVINNKVNLHEMIRIDKVESILNTILNRLDQQDIVIKNLQNIQESYISRNTFERYGNDVKSVMLHLSQRVSTVENASIAVVDNETYVYLT